MSTIYYMKYAVLKAFEIVTIVYRTTHLSCIGDFQNVFLYYMSDNIHYIILDILYSESYVI